jgi:hypothetical protein
MLHELVAAVLYQIPSYVSGKEVARQRNLPMKKEHSEHLEPELTILFSFEKKNNTFSPGLNGGRPLYGQVPHRNASPSPHCSCHLHKGNISIVIARVNSHKRAPNATAGHNTYTATCRLRVTDLLCSEL